MTKPLTIGIALALALTSAAAAGPSASKPPPPARTGPKAQPLSAAARQTAKKYRAALQKGRALTSKKDYPGAVAAFNDALAVRAGDPQALSERGYAYLLAKDYDKALADLEAASKHAVSTVLQGQIWFNRGLIADARGDHAAALKAYAESNRVRPTKAAAAKLGAGVCEATITRGPTAGTVYPGWLAAAQGLAKGSTFADDNTALGWKSDAEAKQGVCGDDGCPGSGPWIIATSDSVGDANYHLVIPRPGGKLLAFGNLGEKMAGRCETDDDVEIVDGGPGLHVHVTSEPNDMVEVDTSSDDLRSCGNNYDHCHEACFYTGKSDLDYFYDLGAGTEVLAIERPYVVTGKDEFLLDEDFAQKVTLAVDKAGVTLKGGACDQQLKLGR
jgi:tetratricopeptide (TPR) repeat protein